MYEPNYNFFFKINNRWFRYILLFLITFFFLFNNFSLFAQDTNDSQSMDLIQMVIEDSMDSDSDLDNSEVPESDITTRIYRNKARKNRFSFLEDYMQSFIIKL